MQLSPHETGRTRATLSSWWSMMWFILLPQMDNTINVFMGGARGLQNRLWLLWWIHMRLFCCWFIQKNINRRQTGDKTENQNVAVTHRHLCVYCNCQGQLFVSRFKSCRRVGARLKHSKSRSSPTAQSQTCGWSASSQEELIFYLMFDWNRTQTPSCFPDIGREITHLQGRFSTSIKCGS